MKDYAYHAIALTRDAYVEVIVDFNNPRPTDKGTTNDLSLYTFVPAGAPEWVVERCARNAVNGWDDTNLNRQAIKMRAKGLVASLERDTKLKFTVGEEAEAVRNAYFKKVLDY